VVAGSEKAKNRAGKRPRLIQVRLLLAESSSIYGSHSSIGTLGHQVRSYKHAEIGSTISPCTVPAAVNWTVRLVRNNNFTPSSSSQRGANPTSRTPGVRNTAQPAENARKNPPLNYKSGEPLMKECKKLGMILAVGASVSDGVEALTSDG